MKKLTHAEISENRSSLETLDRVEKLPVSVLVNSVRSNYNVGSIFRTSDAAMIEKLYLTGYSPHPPKKEIMKTALGATESVQWEYVKDPLEVIERCKQESMKICALEQTNKSIPYYSLTAEAFPLLLIIGNEITGVEQAIIEQCDFSIDIPQHGIKQSLNVAVAYGVTIMECRKMYDLHKG